MKIIFFELIAHLGFLLCHLGCKLAGEKEITVNTKTGEQRRYTEKNVDIYINHIESRGNDDYEV